MPVSEKKPVVLKRVITKPDEHYKVTYTDEESGFTTKKVIDSREYPVTGVPDVFDIMARAQIKRHLAKKSGVDFFDPQASEDFNRSIEVTIQPED